MIAAVIAVAFCSLLVGLSAGLVGGVLLTTGAAALDRDAE